MQWQYTLSGSQRRFLLKLILSQQEPMKSTYKKAPREGLVREGLITLEKRGRAEHMLLTDRAWAGAAGLIAAEVETRSSHDLEFHLLSRLGNYLEAKAMAVEGFVSPPAPDQASASVPSSEASNPAASAAVAPPEPEAPRAPASLEDDLRQACWELSGGDLQRRVRLRDLRARLPAVAAKELDALLLGLVRQGQAHLMPLDDPRERGPEDDAHAVYVAGSPRHIVYLEERRR